MGSKRKRVAHDASSAAPTVEKRQKSSKSTASKTAASPTPLGTSPFDDRPKGVLSAREAGLYELLSSEDSAERLNAANAVVSGLLGGDGVSELTLERHLQKNLFRGLASGRKGARLGRGVVLTEILGQLFGAEKLAQTKYPGLTFDQVLGILIEKTKPEGDTSGQEEKDHFLGLLFGLQSFVRAKIISGEGERWTAILEQLLELAKKKPWIREECGWVVMEAMAQIDQSQAEYTLEKLYDAGLAVTPEGVGIWITAKDRFPSMKFPSKPWGQTGNPLDRLQSLAKALKESSSNDDVKTKGQQANHSGIWNPQLHFVWTIVLAQFANAQKTKKGGVVAEFANFWKVAVDGQ
jgi:DNA polymerase phi